MHQLPTIFIVDEDSIERSFIKTAFDQIEFAVNFIELQDGAEVIEYLKTNVSALPDLVFLDINRSGLEVLRFFQSMPRLSNLPVIIFSTISRVSDKIHALDMGAIQYTVKPATFKGYLELARYAQQILCNVKSN